MKFNKILKSTHPLDIELSDAYEQTLAASEPFFQWITQLKAIQFEIDSGSLYRRQDEETELRRRKLLALWQSAKMAFMAACPTVRLKAQEMLDGPVAQNRKWLLAASYQGPYAALARGNNTIAAKCFAEHILRESEAMCEQIESSSLSAAAVEALKALFEHAFPNATAHSFIDAPPSAERWRPSPRQRHEMVWQAIDFKGVNVRGRIDSDLPEVHGVLISALASLPQAEALLQDLRCAADRLREPTFGSRLERVLDKPNELAALLAEQRSMRCHLASMMSEVLALSDEVRVSPLRELRPLANLLVLAGRQAESEDERLKYMNNALLVADVCRRLNIWVRAVKTEMDENRLSYDIAANTLYDFLRTQEQMLSRHSKNGLNALSAYGKK